MLGMKGYVRNEGIRKESEGEGGGKILKFSTF